MFASSGIMLQLGFSPSLLNFACRASFSWRNFFSYSRLTCLLFLQRSFHLEFIFCKIFVACSRLSCCTFFSYACFSSMPLAKSTRHCFMASGVAGLGGASKLSSSSSSFPIRSAPMTGVGSFPNPSPSSSSSNNPRRTGGRSRYPSPAIAGESSVSIKFPFGTSAMGPPPFASTPSTSGGGMWITPPSDTPNGSSSSPTGPGGAGINTEGSSSSPNTSSTVVVPAVTVPPREG
mmetsp:Transcript_14601/g.29773  ORF Transcript_14601/g.29773 Transcript_14601/m.29773 type:complete len:233 (+) Transcript_14601:294-992(+)